jgi:hypothetical protein
MAGQINLLNPALRKTREWPTALPLAAVALALILLVTVAAVAARLNASRRHAEAESLAENLKQVQQTLLATTQKLAARKPDPGLAAELEHARDQLKRQREILVRLDSGTIGNVQGFSDFLRGFARQVPQGLWLTGFTIDDGGHDMEVRGRMLSPMLLTEYVRRLNAERAFRGLSFQGLEIQRPRTATAATAVQPAYTEFVLSTTPTGEQR